MYRILTSCLLILVCGCSQVSQQARGVTEITCNPKFEQQLRPDLHVMDSQGRQRDAFNQWLILDDRKQNIRIPWGSPPLSRGPVSLHTHQTYTFIIKPEIIRGVEIHKVIRVDKGKETIYEAQEKASNKSDAGDS